MLSISSEFQDAIASSRRKIIGLIEVAFVDPFVDDSIVASANEEARISYPKQTHDRGCDRSGIVIPVMNEVV